MFNARLRHVKNSNSEFEKTPLEQVFPNGAILR